MDCRSLAPQKALLAIAVQVLWYPRDGSRNADGSSAVRFVVRSASIKWTQSRDQQPGWLPRAVCLQSMPARAEVGHGRSGLFSDEYEVAREGSRHLRRPTVRFLPSPRASSAEPVHQDPAPDRRAASDGTSKPSCTALGHPVLVGAVRDQDEGSLMQKWLEVFSYVAGNRRVGSDIALDPRPRNLETRVHTHDLRWMGFSCNGFI